MLCHQKALGTAALAIEKFERENHITLAEEQKEAVEEAMKSRVLVITGGPGTGKRHSCGPSSRRPNSTI